ncbi:MAG: DUF4262 domain-containing protein [Actinobacteria bacterium]|nr:DUF4262 domain-containing protein [Actinomycetota bacterium]
MDPKTRAWMDQAEAQLSTLVRRHRWMIQYVGGGFCDVPGCDGGGDTGPPFAYTVGLFGMGHPELLVFGVSPPDAMWLLNLLAGRIAAGENLIPGQVIGIDHSLQRVVLEEVPNPGDIVHVANRFYRRRSNDSVPVLQVTWDDDMGRFPWDEGCTVAECQPRPGSFVG